eukprot:2719416-Rhodomonas_salina.12
MVGTGSPLNACDEVLDVAVAVHSREAQLGSRGSSHRPLARIRDKKDSRSESAARREWIPRGMEGEGAWEPYAEQVERGVPGDRFQVPVREGEDGGSGDGG